jgi:hypothetical protein
MRSTFTTFVALVSLMPLVSLAAQADQPALIGTRVRITMPRASYDRVGSDIGPPVFVIGQLVAVSDSTMSVRNEADAEVTVPLSRVHRVEVSAGSSRAASARRGGLIGVIAGGIVGFAAGEDCTAQDFICFDRPSTAVAGAAVGAGLGGLIGLVVGGVERWRSTEIPARTSVVPTGTGSFLISATLRF